MSKNFTAKTADLSKKLKKARIEVLREFSAAASACASAWNTKCDAERSIDAKLGLDFFIENQFCVKRELPKELQQTGKTTISIGAMYNYLQQAHIPHQSTYKGLMEAMSTYASNLADRLERDIA